MIKVDIKRQSDNVIAWGGQFADQSSADAWIAGEVANNSWGLPERWEALQDNDPKISSALDSREVIEHEADDSGPEASHMEYQLPAEYIIVSSDVSAQATLEAKTSEAMNNQSLGAWVIARVAAVNESKLSAGSMTQQQFMALLADQNMANIERLLWNGSLVTAKAMISALDHTYYSAPEIASILAMLP